MSPNYAAELALDPQPFREWVEARLAAPARPKDSLGEAAAQVSVDVLAEELGLNDRVLYRWRFENQTLHRFEVENALFRVGVQLWEVYPDDPGARPEKGRGGVLPGVTGKLRDPQFELLHRLHVERGMSVAEMGRRLWKQVGYASPDAASFAIRRAWKRLELPAYRRPLVADPVGRCKGIKRNYPNKGKRCTEWAMAGKDFCREHDPERRAEVQAQITKAREFVDPRARAVA